jgi:predicted nuclease of predicted toxin-antitoxin system
LLGASDDQHLAWALAEGRVLFTQDDDFLRLHAAGFPHAGIAYCHPESRSIGEVIRGLVLIWDIYEPHEMHNRVEYL